MKKTLLPLLLAGIFSIGGCKTADYTRQDINKIPKKNIEMLVENIETAPSLEQEKKESLSLKYTKTRDVLEKYEKFPEHKVNLYFPGQEIRELDTTGFLNQYADEIKSLEDSIPEDSKRIRLGLGEPDRDEFASQRSGDNQLSDESGLFGVDSYFTKGKGNFLIDVREVTKVENWKNKKEYYISVLFGQQAFNAVKEREDWLYGLETLEDSGVGFAVGGGGGAGGVGASKLIGGIWAYFEGINPPKKTSLSDNKYDIGGLEKKSADVYSNLRFCKNTETKSKIIVPYSEGTGIIYAGDIKDVKYQDNGVIFRVDKQGINHIKDFLYRLLQAGTRFCCGGDGGDDIISGNKFGGGQTGGPGGGGTGGGGQGGGAGGG